MVSLSILCSDLLCLEVFGLLSFTELRSFLIFKETDRPRCSGERLDGDGGIHGFAVRNGEECEYGFGVGSLCCVPLFTVNICPLLSRSVRAVANCQSDCNESNGLTLIAEGAREFARELLSLNVSFSPKMNPILLHSCSPIDLGNKQSSAVVVDIARKAIRHLKLGGKLQTG